MQSRQSRKSSTTIKRTNAIRISSHTVHLHERFGVEHARAISRINRITQHEVLGRCPWASLHLRKSNSKGRSKNYGQTMFSSSIVCGKDALGDETQRRH